jgi:peptidoglycan hydrolase CwlO-like protein
LHALEDDNLFKVDNLQTDDETLEQIKLNSEREIAKMQAKIAKTEANISEQQEKLDTIE